MQCSSIYVYSYVSQSKSFRETSEFVLPDTIVLSSRFYFSLTKSRLHGGQDRLVVQLSKDEKTKTTEQLEGELSEQELGLVQDVV
jgi:hypothetical protein